MSFGGIKRDKYDIVFSDLVRERSNWTCELCSRQFPEGTRQALHCSHLFGRRYLGTRFNPDNCFSLCAGCHMKMGENPVEHHEWARKRLGDGLIEILREKAQKVRKLPKPEKEEMYRHYRAELKRLESLRKAGEIGRIEFEGWV